MPVTQMILAATARSSTSNILENSSWQFTSTGQGTYTLVSNGTATLNGTTNLTLIVDGSVDDGSTSIPVPWGLTFDGSAYPPGYVYVGSNSYLTFGNGSSEYMNLGSGNPNLPKIMIDASDNSYQRVYGGEFGVTPNRSYLVRYEGTNSTGGDPGFSNMIWEIRFYEATPNIYDINIGSNARAGQGISGIYSADTLITLFV